MEFLYSYDDEIYYESLDEIFDNYWDEIVERFDDPDVEQVTLYKGEKDVYTHKSFLNGYTIIEDSQERVYDYALESIAEDYLENYKCTEEDIEELEELISNWLTKKFGKVDFWGIKNCREFKLTREEFENLRN